MKQKEYSRKSVCKWNAKRIATLVSVALLGIAGVGTTIAFLYDKTEKVDNIFEPSQVTSKVVEDSFDGTTKTKAKIQNTGDISAFIRADIIVTWMDVEGNVLAETPAEGEDKDYTMILGNGWFEKDGYYYWPDIVEADKETDPLIVTATANNVKDVNGTKYYVSIEIVSSAIQANGMGKNAEGNDTYPVTLAWGVSCDGTHISGN